MAMYSNDDPEAAEKMRQMIGPGHVDQTIRRAIQTCWMMLPAGRKTVDELEKELRRIFERAIKNLREDSGSFGL